MMKKTLALFVLATFLVAGYAHAAEVVLFDFEDGLEGWEIPDWAFEKPDMVQEEIGVSSEYASHGQSSMYMEVDFTGGMWTGAIAEILQYYDWTDYGILAVDIYLPEDAPTGLNAKIILTVGNNWQWVEMSRSYALIPGQWNTISADIKKGSIDWRRVQVDDEFRKDIRKINVRVESNNKPAYKGRLYIDNVRVSE